DRRMSSSALRVESDLQLLFDVYRRIGTALRKIAAQPTRTLRRERRLGRWRAGDIVGTSAVDRMAREGRITRTDRLSLPDKMLLDRPRLATDIEEHRHIRAGIVRLAERAGAISRYCGRAISLLQEEEGRWSEEALRQKIEPKVYGLALIREQAHDLQGRVRRLLEEHPFLAGASLPRTPFGPTPIFLGRPAYREAYRALLDARRHASNRYESERGRVRFRDLATLYEYWLFVRVVGFLSEMYGPPTNNQGFALVDEFYRPELKPGQQFRFRLPHGDHLTATYEPDFPPVVSRARERFRAAMVSAPLRPDVTLELTMPGRPTAILALDAKSGPRFRKADERLLATATYLLWIHDPVTGHQPVRQLFLVHRDMDAPPLANLTGYLEGRVSNPDARVIGAVPAQPRATEALEHVILRFLETYRARKWK
ncbi:MAG TPA: nuclease domain-containing protein, partial [Planctomycetota bacterium]|nr:nuclease domain-containing protein [Planctomycetota bacterium]